MSTHGGSSRMPRKNIRPARHTRARAAARFERGRGLRAAHMCARRACQRACQPQRFAVKKRRASKGCHARARRSAATRVSHAGCFPGGRCPRPRLSAAAAVLPAASSLPSSEKGRTAPRPLRRRHRTPVLPRQPVMPAMHAAAATFDVAAAAAARAQMSSVTSYLRCRPPPPRPTAQARRPSAHARGAAPSPSERHAPEVTRRQPCRPYAARMMAPEVVAQQHGRVALRRRREGSQRCAMACGSRSQKAGIAGAGYVADASLKYGCRLLLPSNA